MPVEGVVPPSVGRFSNLIKVVEVINPDMLRGFCSVGNWLTIPGNSSDGVSLKCTRPWV